ncbi:hypothetical protein QOT17_019058 [Balamuthia mandrillaris]
MEKEVVSSSHPLFLFNLEPEDLFSNSLRRSNGMKCFLQAYQALGVPYQILVLSERPLDEGRKDTVGNQLKQFTTKPDLDAAFQVVSQVYQNGRVDPSAPLSGETYGDNTKPLPWQDDTFDLVLGRGVICCCGTTHSGGPCGVPANLTQFLCEVGRVLKPQSGKRRCQALLHGDGPGGDYHLWKAAARGLPPNVHATALFYNQTMRGLRIYKTAAASSGEGEAAIDASASSSSSSG